MNYPSPAKLAENFRFTTRLIHMQAKDLTHAESLLLPPFRANCFNWVLGHILTSRDTCLRLMGLPLSLTPEELAVYDRGSLPLTDPAAATALETLLAKLDDTAERLSAALSAEPDLDRRVTFGRGEQPLGEVIAFLHWHETYHTGQLELLRQLAGKNDQVV